MNKKIEILKFMLKLQRRCVAKGLNVYVTNIDTDKCYSVYKDNVRGMSIHFWEDSRDYMNIEKNLKDIEKLFEPKYTQIKKACIDIIGETVYINKKTPIVIKSILSKEQLLTEEDDVVLINDCWIKE